MRQNTKINRHEKIAALLKTGQPVSPEKIREAFESDRNLTIYEP